MSNINFFALGGQDENGKNSLVIETEKDIFVINAGIKVPINNKNGIDGIIPEFQHIIERKEKVRGLFITHVHDENFAALPWLLMEMPGLKIYGSQFTIDVAKDRVSKYKLEHNDFEFIVLKDVEKFGEITLRSYEVANSILGSLSFNFQTPDGDIIIMSNMVNDDLGVFGKTDLAKMKKEAKEIMLLCLDARISNYNGSSKDKKSIKPFVIEEFQKAKDDERIIVGGYDEEMFNLQEIMELAKNFNRPVASYGRNFDFLYETLKNDATVIMPTTISYQTINDQKNAVVLVTGSWSRLYQRFVRISEGNDVYLKLKDTDHVILMAPPINGMEVEYSETLDQIAKSANNIIDITENNLYRLRPAKQDIFDIVSIFKPKYFVPISALYRYLITSTKQAIDAGVTRDRCIILVNGKIAQFSGGKLASQKASIKNWGDVLIDGFGVGDISFEVIRERQSLAASGLVSIAMNIDRNSKKVIGDMVIQLVGVAAKQQLNDLQEHIKNIAIQKLEGQEKFEYREYQNSVRKKVQKVINKLIGKEPLVVVTISEL